MSEKQFDIFDEPFREAAGHYEPEFSEDAWKKMEAKLDGEPKRRRPVAWLWWFSDLIMIALVLTLFFELHHSKNGTINPSSVQQVKPATKQGQEITKEAIEKTNQQTLPREEVIGTNESSPAPINENSVLEAKHHSAKNNYQLKASREIEKTVTGNSLYEENNGTKTVSTPKDIPVIAEDEPARQNQEGSATGKNLVSGENLIISANPVSVPANGNAVNANAEDKDLPESSTSNHFTAANTSQTESAVSPAPALATPATAIVKPGMKPFKGFYFQAGLAPEWSFIAGNKPGQITAAYGGSLGYSFGKRLSVQAGIFSTKKLYEAGPGDYNYYNLKVNHVEADCRVMEIPLTVNYLLHSRGKNMFFGTAGFASLIMKKEIYDIDFVSSTGIQLYRQKIYQTNAFNAFSTMLLGAGYGYSINKHFMFSAEPYMKIPLYGVGEGKVKINSAGILLGLQYGFGSRRKETNVKSASVQQ
jgi:hypothetical protein